VAVGEGVLDAEAVVVGGAVLKGKTFAAAGRGFEADGAAAGPEIGLDAEELRRVGDIARVSSWAPTCALCSRLGTSGGVKVKFWV